VVIGGASKSMIVPVRIFVEGLNVTVSWFSTKTMSVEYCAVTDVKAGAIMFGLILTVFD
jgi:fumarate reductase subunit D